MTVVSSLIVSLASMIVSLASMIVSLASITASTAAESGTCGPYVCRYPRPAEHAPGDRWTCDRCGTPYRLSRRVPDRPWRRQCAPDGAWRVDLAEATRARFPAR